MKRTLLFQTGFLLLFALNGLQAQTTHGLEHIVVEKYYVSDAADSVASVGLLPVGSVTYRIFVDMLPGYKFEAVYGNSTHLLSIATTSTFFNNEDRGAITPNAITLTYDKRNTVMLDSWISVGGAASGKLGILKKFDTDGSIGNSNGILQSTDTSAGIPLKTNDGMVSGTPAVVTVVDPNLQTELGNVLDATSQQGNLISTTDGAWASLNGSYGADSLSNMILIGQFTTNGRFSFKLNIQLGTLISGELEDYVADSATGKEIVMSELNYTSPAPIHLGIEPKNTLDYTVNVYPNPAHNTLILELNSTQSTCKGTYELYNCIGEMILSKDLGQFFGQRKENILFGILPPGIYYLKTVLNGFPATRKIVKN
jgi:hypothetical protein